MKSEHEREALDRAEVIWMDSIIREGFKKLRSGRVSSAIRGVVQAVGAVAEDGEDTLDYLVACYQGAKVIAASGDVTAAINLMNMVPKEVAEEPAHASTLATLALEIGEGIRRLGDPDAAEQVVGLSHALRRDLYGPHHPKTGLSSLMAARVCFDQERFSDAHKFFEGASVGLGPYHPFNALVYAERAFAIQMIAPNASLFPEFALSAPLPYWRRLIRQLAQTTLKLPLDLRLAVLLEVSSEIEDIFEEVQDLSRPLLEVAHRYSSEAKDERAEVLSEIIQERGWTGSSVEIPTLEDEVMTEEFWRSPDREETGEMTEMDALFALFEGAAEASAGRKDTAIEKFRHVVEGRSDEALEHWAAQGCLHLIERGWKLRHSQFKPELRAIEARAYAKLPKTTRNKVKGIELVTGKGSLDVAFLGAELTDAQQKRAMKVVQEALSWVTDRSEDAS